MSVQHLKTHAGNAHFVMSTDAAQNSTVKKIKVVPDQATKNIVKQKQVTKLFKQIKQGDYDG